MNGLMTPKVQSFSRAEFEQEIYARSSGIGYEGPLIKKLQPEDKTEDIMVHAENEQEGLLISTS